MVQLCILNFLLSFCPEYWQNIIGQLSCAGNSCEYISLTFYSEYNVNEYNIKCTWEISILKGTCITTDRKILKYLIELLLELWWHDKFYVCIFEECYMISASLQVGFVASELFMGA